MSFEFSSSDLIVIFRLARQACLEYDELTREVSTLCTIFPEESIITAYSNDEEFRRTFRKELVKDGYPSALFDNIKT